MIFNNYSPKAKLILLNNLRDEVEGIIQDYNPLINFRGILLAILGHVIPNRKASIRQYWDTPCHEVNKVSVFSVLIFFNNLKWKQ